MDTKQFLAEFGHIVGASQGMRRVREMILFLATSGKLTSGREGEGNAIDAIKEAFYLKEEYKSAYNLSGSGPLTPVRSDEAHFVLPSHWAWERLGNIACYIQRGKGPKYDETSEALVVSQKCVKWEGFDLSFARGIDREFLEKYGQERYLQPNDLLWNSTGTGTVGRACIFNKCSNTAVVADSHVTIVRFTNFLAKYVWCYIASRHVQQRFDPTNEFSLVSGTTNQVELTTTNVNNLLIPCPPISEQKRIIAKVDELMALCDKIEAQQKKRQQLHAITRTIAIDTFSNASGLPELKYAWHRVKDNWPLFFDRPDDVDFIRNAIKHMACRGLLIKDGTVIGKQKNEEPFPIPEDWKWTTLNELSEYITSGSRSWRKYISNAGDIFIRSHDIKTDQLRLLNTAFVELPKKTEGKRTLVKKDDILITITGANVGKCAIAQAIDNKAYVSQHVALIRLKDPKNALYLHIWLTNAYGGRKELLEGSYGDKPGLNLKQIANLNVPLPPYTIQKKLVDTINRKASLCKQLEVQLNKSQNFAAKLAEAAVAAITGIHTKDKEPMKAPQTELVTRLLLAASPGTKDQAPLCAILARHNGTLSAKALWNYSGLEIDGFYHQLKIEMAQGWISEPEKARVIEKAVPDSGKAV